MQHNQYLVSGSQVNLVVKDLTSEVQAEFDKIALTYPHIKMDVLQVNLDLVEQLVTTELIAEIIDSEDTDLVIKAGVKDFLLTNQFVSKILAQVSQEPDVMSIYRDLFSVEGSELYIKPLSLYFPAEQPRKLTFALLCKSCTRA